MLTFRDSNKSIKIEGDLLEKVANYDFVVNLSNPQDQILIYEFGKEKILILSRKDGKALE